MHPKPPTFALALVAFLALPLAADEPKEKAAERSAPPASEAAMKIHVDPATGQIVSKPAPGTKSALAAAPARELPALKIENGKTKAGGRRVRLDDRFMMEMSAVAGPDGKVSSACVAEHERAPKPADPAQERRNGQ